MFVVAIFRYFLTFYIASFINKNCKKGQKTPKKFFSIFFPRKKYFFITSNIFYVCRKNYFVITRLNRRFLFKLINHYLPKFAPSMFLRVRILEDNGRDLPQKIPIFKQIKIDSTRESADLLCE